MLLFFFVFYSVTDAKIHAMKALGSPEPTCPSRSWKGARTSSSTRLNPLEVMADDVLAEALLVSSLQMTGRVIVAGRDQASEHSDEAENARVDGSSVESLLDTKSDQCTHPQ